ncbi:14067_t:CDS:2, partial [Entrophospora sp. SA101]
IASSVTKDEDGRGQKEELESEKFVFNCLEASVGSEDNINLKCENQNTRESVGLVGFVGYLYKYKKKMVNENDEFTNPLTDDDNQQALVHQIKEFIIVIDEPLVTEDTEIVEMVLEDAQIEADTNIDSDEGNEEPH